MTPSPALHVPPPPPPLQVAPTMSRVDLGGGGYMLILSGLTLANNYTLQPVYQGAAFQVPRTV